MALRKSEQEKQAEAAHRAREAFEVSPAGQARSAYARGDAFYQVQIPHADVRRPHSLAGESQQWLAESSADHLAAIEAEGWRLEHAGFVYVMTGQTSRDKIAGWSGGQLTAVNGQVNGIYLFRRRPTPH